MSGNVVAVSSGKGGVGKTSLTVNLAVALAATGKKVLVCDGDLGLANVDITLGLKPEFDLHHVLSGERTLDQIVIEGPQGVGVIPAASGISKMLELSPAQRLEMGLVTRADFIESSMLCSVAIYIISSNSYSSAAGVKRRRTGVIVCS